MNSIFKSYKFRLYPTDSQKVLLGRHFGSARFVYNYFLAKRIETYKLTGKTVSEYDQSKQLTELKKQKEYSWLNEVSSVALQRALNNLDKAYKNFFARIKKGDAKAGFPKFKNRFGKNSYSIPQTSLKNRDKGHYSFRIIRGAVRLPKFDAPIKAVIDTMPQGDPFAVTVSRSPSGKYFISVMCKSVHHIPKMNTGLSVGIDLGLSNMVITSTGDKYESKKRLLANLKELKHLQRQLSKKNKGSCNYKKYKLKLAKLHENISELRRKDIDLITKILVEKYDVICVETLTVKNMIKNHKLAQRISDVAWGMFLTILKQKADKHNKQVIQIDRFFASTQTCNVCGTLNKNLKGFVNLNVREWTCDCCGAKHDRDINAAINIHKRGLEILGELHSVSA